MDPITNPQDTANFGSDVSGVPGVTLQDIQNTAGVIGTVGTAVKDIATATSTIKNTFAPPPATASSQTLMLAVGALVVLYVVTR